MQPTNVMISMKASVKEASLAMMPLARIIRFLAKYPPSQYSSIATGQAIPTPKQRVAMNAKPISATKLPLATSLPTAEDMYSDESTAAEIDEVVQQEELDEPAIQLSPSSSATQTFPPNPFMPYKNPETGRWRGPRLGLRQQADLNKCAQKLGVEELLPPSIKSAVYKQQRALERGLAVRGTGEGQRVKGHKWERTKAVTLEKRRQAMEEMPQLIRDWEQRGHGRGWKKYPREKNV